MIITKSIYIIDYIMQTWSANQLRNRWLAGWHGISRRVFRESRSLARLIGRDDKLWPSRAEQGRAGESREDALQGRWLGCRNKQNRLIITKSIYIIDYIMQTWSTNQLRNRWLAGW